MKKTTLLILCLIMTTLGFSQTAQNFGTSGQDSAPTVLTINDGDITVNGGDPITAISIGTFTSHFNTATGNTGQCGNWYDFILNVTGGVADGTSIQGCDADFNGIDVTGFTTITLTSNDLDGTDTVFFDVDLLVTFTPSSAPDCDATLTQTANVATTGDISWTAATGSVDNYSVSVGTTSGATDVYSATLGNVLTTNIGTLTDGTTYYVNIIPSNVNGPAIGCTEQTFTTLQPVVNDTQATAIPITPAAEGTGCSSAQFTLAFDLDGTTDSGVDGSCNGTSTGLDQWFTWTATSDGLLFLDTAPGNPGIVVRDTSGNEIDCAQTFTSTNFPSGDVLSGWTIGQDLIIQIYDFAGSTSTVAFCLEEFTLPPAPSCAEAPISPMNNAIDVDPTSGSVTFSWTAPSSGPAPTDYEFFFGETSGDLGSLGTLGSTNTTVDITNISANTTYYWQVVPINGGTPAAGPCTEWTFSTGAVTPPTTIASFNIDGCGDFDTVSQAFGVGEVYWVEVIYDGNCDALVMDTADSTTTGTLDTEIGIYDVDGNLIGSNDDATGISPLSLFIADALPAGTYYIAASAFNTTFGQPFNVTTADTADTGTLVFNVYTVVLNDDCADAEVIDAADFGSTLSGSNVGATNSGVADVCVTGNDVWYSFTTDTDGGDITVTLDSGFEYAIYTDCAGTLADACNTGLTGAPADTTYYLRIGDDGSPSTRAEGTFSFSLAGSALSTSDFDTETGFTYYPNPVKNTLTINAQQNIDTVTMYNMLGQEVLRLSPNSVNATVDMTNLSTGAYFAKVSILGNTETVRIIKQ